MFRKFVDRKRELSFLTRIHASKGFKFGVLYGRRRLGKTELLKNFLKGKPHIYLLCDKKGTENNIIRLKRKISRLLGEPMIETADLEEIFSYLTKKTENLVVVFDEFSYLVEKDGSVPSLFQVAVDEVLKNTSVMLILCGSSISMMERGVLSYKSPLYGRKTHHLKLEALSLKDFFDFFPGSSIEKNICFHAVLGGVPSYMEKFKGKASVKENILTEIASREGRLFEEIDFLLREELREPDTYKKILEAIAGGCSRVVEISNKSRIGVNDLDRYLKVLINLGIVKRETPVTEIKGKKAIYFINDNLFDFWFRFVEPFKSDIMIDEKGFLEKGLDEGLNAYVGRKFEKIIREQVVRRLKLGSFERVGRWWGHYRSRENLRKEVEIDIVALNGKSREILFAECKWKNKANPEKIARELVKKSKYVDWHSGQRTEKFAIFAKSFSKRLKGLDGKKVYCFDLSDIEKILAQPELQEEIKKEIESAKQEIKAGKFLTTEKLLKELKIDEV